MRVTIIVIEHSAEPLTSPDLARVAYVRRIGQDEPVTESLVMAFKMIMSGEFLDRFP